MKIKQSASFGFVAAVLILMPSRGLCFPYGGPASLCADPYPHHTNIASQTSEAPFEIVLMPKTYRPGENVTVTIKAKDGYAIPTFSGYQIAAHTTKGRWDNLHGAFVSTAVDSRGYSYYSTNINCLTHSNNARRSEITMVWEAPSSSVGDILFSATLVKTFEIFWVNVTAELGTSVLPVFTPTDQVLIPTSSILSLEDCEGRMKGCLMWPRPCSSLVDCDYIVTYEVIDSTAVRFQLAAKSLGYVSLGISLDKKMDRDETLTCMAVDGRLSYQHGYNPGYYNQRVAKGIVTNISIRHEDGHIVCELVRPISANLTMYNGMSYLFDLSQQSFYLYLGMGRVYPGSQDSMMKHDELPVVSASAIDVFKPSNKFFAAIPLEVQIHATLMLVAWLGCASAASLIARYFRRSLLGKTKLFGLAAWLQVHRVLTIVAAVLTAASFILIFCFVNGWTKVASLHAIFGVLSTTLVAAQVLMGLLRPSPTSSWRRHFAWCHRVGGITAWLLAAVTALLGANVEYFPPRIASWGTGVLAIWIAFQIIFCAVFEAIRCRASAAKTVEGELPGSASLADKDTVVSDKSRCNLSHVLLLYLGCITSLLVVSLVWVWYF